MTTEEGTPRLTTMHDTVVIVLLLVLLLAGLEAALLRDAIPNLVALEIARVLLGLLLVLVAPGYLLLCLLRIETRRPTLAAVYIVGLGPAFLLVVAGVTTLAFGPMGADIQRPFDAVGWVFISGLLLLALIVLFQRSQRDFDWAFTTTSKWTPSWFLVLCLLPVLAVAATRLLESSGNTLALIVVGLLAVIPILIGADVIPRELHPVAVWSVSLAILLSMTLVTDHIWGWDIHFQYGIARSILNEGVWSPGFGGFSTSLLTTTVLAAAYTRVTSLELIWVHKLLYAFLGSTLPVVVYHLSDRLFDDHRVAGLAPFALMFYYGFFKFFPDKQIISLLFFALALLALFDTSMSESRRRGLSLVFAALMILSHYGVSLLFFGFLGGAALFVVFARIIGIVDRSDPNVVRPTFILFGVLLWYVWFRYSAQGANLSRIVEVGYETILAFETGGGSDRSGSGYLARALISPLWALYTALNAVLLGFVLVGLVHSVGSVISGDQRVPPVYITLAGLVFGFLGSSVVAIYGMGFDRTMFIAMVVLAPFTVVGFRALMAIPIRIISRGRFLITRQQTAAMFGIFLSIFFLFSSGAAFVLADDTVPPYSINVDENANWHTYSDAEVGATRWIERHGAADTQVAVFNDGDVLKSRDAFLLVEVVENDRIELVWPGRTEFEGEAYVYVSDRPMVADTDGPSRSHIDPENTAFYETHLATADVVYASGSARIYRIRDSEAVND